MLSVVCWKWRGGTVNRQKKYDARHVNILRAQVARNLSMEHEFVCVTDDRHGLHPAIRVVDIDKDFTDHSGMGKCYRRLKAFSPEAARTLGRRFAWMDLDAVITGTLDPLFSGGEDFKMWGDTAKNTAYNGSMCMMDAGARSQVWETFRGGESQRLTKQKRIVGSDQAWISHVLGPGEAKWSTADGVYSWRMHLMGDHAVGSGEPPDLPNNSRIVYFHGKHDPSHLDWVPWVRENWHDVDAEKIAC